MFKLLKTEGKARRGEFTCAHGTVQTPVFMNVGTQGAIKGALSAEDLNNIGCQVELSNTYHLHLRPGDKLFLYTDGVPEAIDSAENMFGMFDGGFGFGGHTDVIHGMTSTVSGVPVVGMIIGALIFVAGLVLVIVHRKKYGKK